jgi:excisionase family DNA binding protein
MERVDLAVSGQRAAPAPSTAKPELQLLTVEQAAARLGTSVRFIRRLVAERRIAFTKLGRHVRIDEEDLSAFIAAGRVEPAPARRAR